MQGWVLEHEGAEEAFDRVVVASGRFHTPTVPPVPGLEAFHGAAGAVSTYHYKEPGRYRGLRMLVAGCAVSALEIATELVHNGAARVVVTQRRQRYVLPKFAAGVPSDHRIFTRYGVLAEEALPRDEVDRQLKEIVVEAGGSPEQYGAPAPAESLFAAGVTLNQHYLPLVGEGRIEVRPWMEQIDGMVVRFADDTAGEFDGILLGTGFDLDLPFLDDEIRGALDLDPAHLDAHLHTFNPDLPGLAFLGLWDQSGGYFVPIELQARWVANAWSGVVPAPTDGELRAAVARYRSRRGLSQKTRMNLVAIELRARRPRRASPRGMARAASGPPVRSVGAELLSARGPRRVAGRSGALCPRRRGVRRDRIQRPDRARAGVRRVARASCPHLTARARQTTSTRTAPARRSSVAHAVAVEPVV